MTDGEKAIEVLKRMHAICLAHLGAPKHRPNEVLSKIIGQLDPWPLSEPPRS